MTPEAFLRTIAENPDDDGPRLVYADWLEERGDPLGEFIRVQCELARAERGGELHRVQNLHKREDELLTAHRAEWLGPLAGFTNDESLAPYFHRGFVERINVDADVFVGEHETIGGICPMLQSAVLFRVAEFVEGVTLCPLLGRLSKLGIADWIDYDHALMLANSRHSVDLNSVWLWVRDYSQTLETGLALVDAPSLNEIKLIHLYDSTHDTQLSDDETRWRQRVEDELNERTLADRGAIFDVVSTSNRLYQLRSNVDRSFHAGRIDSGEFLLAVIATGDLLHVVRFDATGKRLGAESRSLRRFRRFQSDYDEAVTFREQQQYLKNEFAFEPSTIQVQQFIDPCGLAVHQFSSRHWSLIVNSEFRADLNYRSGHDRAIFNWVESQRFVLDWGSEIWLSGDGEGLL